MSRDTVNAICRTFPGAEVSDPWGGGHDAWKVGGKMFACIGSKLSGVNIKTDSIETAEMLIEMGWAARRPTSTAPGSTFPGTCRKTSFAGGSRTPTESCGRGSRARRRPPWRL